MKVDAKSGAALNALNALDRDKSLHQSDGTPSVTLEKTETLTHATATKNGSLRQNSMIEIQVPGHSKQSDAYSRT